jgi:hypothetical protein
LGQAHSQTTTCLPVPQTEPWEDFLADQLGQVYRKSGVLVLMDNAHLAVTPAAATASSRGQQPGGGEGAEGGGQAADEAEATESPAASAPGGS